MARDSHRTATTCRTWLHGPHAAPPRTFYVQLMSIAVIVLLNVRPSACAGLCPGADVVTYQDVVDPTQDLLVDATLHAAGASVVIQRCSVQNVIIALDVSAVSPACPIIIRITDVNATLLAATIRLTQGSSVTVLRSTFGRIKMGTAAMATNAAVVPVTLELWNSVVSYIAAVDIASLAKDTAAIEIAGSWVRQHDALSRPLIALHNTSVTLSVNVVCPATGSCLSASSRASFGALALRAAAECPSVGSYVYGYPLIAADASSFSTNVVFSVSLTATPVVTAYAVGIGLESVSADRSPCQSANLTEQFFNPYATLANGTNFSVNVPAVAGLNLAVGVWLPWKNPVTGYWVPSIFDNRDRPSSTFGHMTVASGDNVALFFARSASALALRYGLGSQNPSALPQLALQRDVLRLRSALFRFDEGTAITLELRGATPARLSCALLRPAESSAPFAWTGHRIVITDTNMSAARLLSPRIFSDNAVISAEANPQPIVVFTQSSTIATRDATEITVENSTFDSVSLVAASTTTHISDAVNVHLSGVSVVAAGGYFISLLGDLAAGQLVVRADSITLRHVGLMEVATVQKTVCKMHDITSSGGMPVLKGVSAATVFSLARLDYDFAPRPLSPLSSGSRTSSATAVVCAPAVVVTTTNVKAQTTMTFADSKLRSSLSASAFNPCDSTNVFAVVLATSMIESASLFNFVSVQTTAFVSLVKATDWAANTVVRVSSSELAYISTAVANTGTAATGLMLILNRVRSVVPDAVSSGGMLPVLNSGAPQWTVWFYGTSFQTPSKKFAFTLPSKLPTVEVLSSALAAAKFRCASFDAVTFGPPLYGMNASADLPCKTCVLEADCFAPFALSVRYRLDLARCHCRCDSSAIIRVWGPTVLISSDCVPYYVPYTPTRARTLSAPPTRSRSAGTPTLSDGSATMSVTRPPTKTRTITRSRSRSHQSWTLSASTSLAVTETVSTAPSGSVTDTRWLTASVSVAASASHTLLFITESETLTKSRELPAPPVPPSKYDVVASAFKTVLPADVAEAAAPVILAIAAMAGFAGTMSVTKAHNMISIGGSSQCLLAAGDVNPSRMWMFADWPIGVSNTARLLGPIIMMAIVTITGLAGGFILHRVAMRDKRLRLAWGVFAGVLLGYFGPTLAALSALALTHARTAESTAVGVCGAAIAVALVTAPSVFLTVAAGIFPRLKGGGYSLPPVESLAFVFRTQYEGARQPNHPSGRLMFFEDLGVSLLLAAASGIRPSDGDCTLIVLLQCFIAVCHLAFFALYRPPKNVVDAASGLIIAVLQAALGVLTLVGTVTGEASIMAPPLLVLAIAVLLESGVAIVSGLGDFLAKRCSDEEQADDEPEEYETDEPTLQAPAQPSARLSTALDRVQVASIKKERRSSSPSPPADSSSFEASPLSSKMSRHDRRSSSRAVVSDGGSLLAAIEQQRGVQRRSPLLDSQQRSSRSSSSSSRDEGQPPQWQPAPTLIMRDALDGTTMRRLEKLTPELRDRLLLEADVIRAADAGRLAFIQGPPAPPRPRRTGRVPAPYLEDMFDDL
jgi:hypothetical protein